MVHVTLPFLNVTAKPNGIRFKYPDGKISQATHSDLWKLPLLPVETRHVHLFDTLASGLLLSLGKLFYAGCTAYFSAKKSTSYFRGNYPPRSQICLHYLPV